MPNRFIKESIIASETLAELTGDEERLFWRLIVLADDFGRYYGDPVLLRPQCFPRLIAEIEQAAFEGWLRRLVEVGLIQLYEVAGKRYLQVVTWSAHQQQRAKNSKFPPSPADSGNGLHLISPVIKRNQPLAHVPVFEFEFENENDNDARAGESESEEPVRPSDPIPQAWHDHIGIMGPNVLPKLDAWVSQNGMEPEAVALAIEVASEAKRQEHPDRKPSLGYVEGVLRNWFNEGVRTAEQAQRRRGGDKDEPAVHIPTQEEIFETVRRQREAQEALEAAARASPPDPELFLRRAKGGAPGG